MTNWRHGPSLIYQMPLEKLCLCTHCLYLEGCRGCGDWHMETTIHTRTGARPAYMANDSSHSEKQHVVTVREWHSSACPMLLPPYAEGVTRVDTALVPRAFGPRNRFEPVAIASVLEIDFTEHPDVQWLYRAFDEPGSLLYVGITKDPRARMRKHQRDSEWWPEAHYVEFEVHPDRRAVAMAERLAIRMELPRFNIVD